MKTLYLSAPILLFLIFTACKKEKEPQYTSSVCGSKGDLKTNVTGKMGWNESVNDWVLKIDFGNEGDFENRMPLIDCKGFPEELQQEGVKIVGDVAIKIYPNPGAIRLAAKTIELKEYKIIGNSER